jgi:hypothetical protein
MSVVEGALPERRHRVHWWKEALLVAAFYLLYSWTRNRFGSNALDPGEPPGHAFHNAERVIRFERFIGMYHEVSIQQLFLGQRAFIQFWNTYYGTAHFIVTLAVFALLFWKRPGVFPVWRNSLAIMTGCWTSRATSTAGSASRATCAARAARSATWTRWSSSAAPGRSTPTP